MCGVRLSVDKGNITCDTNAGILRECVGSGFPGRDEQHLRARRQKSEARGVLCECYELRLPSLTDFIAPTITVDFCNEFHEWHLDVVVGACLTEVILAGKQVCITLKEFRDLDTVSSSDDERQLV